MRFSALTVIIAATVFSNFSYAQGKSKRVSLAPGATTTPAETAQMQEPGHEAEIRRGFRFEAFIDTEVRYGNDDWSDVSGDKGFTLNDAALILAKDLGQGASALVDLPFNGTASTAFDFAKNRSQAYLQWNHQALTGRLGQFDTFFGLEANNSRDRFFANAGAIKSIILPDTHAGVTVAYNIQQVTVRGMIANPPAAGVMAKDTNPQFGAQAQAQFGQASASFGFLLHEDKGKNPNANQLVDLMGTYDLEKFKLGASFDYKKTSGFDKSTTALGILGTVPMERGLSLGGRFEYLKDPVVAAGALTGQIDTAFTIAVGAGYKLTDDVTMRGDVTFGNFKPTSDQKNAGAKELSPFGFGVSFVANL